MLSQLRTLVTPLRQRLAAPLARRGMAPDILSLLAIPLALGAALLVTSWPLPALALAIASFLVDFLDGEVARLQQRTSPFGSCLDAVVDRVVEGILLAGLAITFPLAATCALATGNLVSYIKARVGLVIVLDNRDWPGTGDRSDRAALLLTAFLMLALHRPHPAHEVLWALTALGTLGSLQRLAHARHLVREAEARGELISPT